ncbi:MAG TPA: HEXXH motif-containing putative peptide modification protein, partial [Candidatus Polarisedimenticolia bacterium]|nr:HEXXH motif-containing putative peptide modification protein [Candidatus Polarisedimenticolia bacterium]
VPPSDDTALFTIAARGPHLLELAPAGRLDTSFRRRAEALGRRLVARALARLPEVLMFRTPPGRCFGPFPLDPKAEAEDPRRSGEIHVWAPVPATLRVAPGARVELAGSGVRIVQPGRSVGWARRELIEGSGIALARRAVSTRAGLRTGPPVPGLAGRLGRALDLLGRAWPEAREEVLAHTRVVVPLLERGTVSFSSPDRPGVSYINVWGKSRVDLVDDLLHETSHHRLHALEELGSLDRDDGEPRYHSPWRRGLRPVRGILHATYTFMHRAELLRRLLRLRRAPALPRAWLRRELAFEDASIESSLQALADAERRGLLTRKGGSLVAAMSDRCR